MSQQVYILEDKNSGLLKIGISVDVAVRVGQVNKEFGCNAEVIGVLDATDARKTERFIHGMLEDCRVVGEWFEVPGRKRNYLLAYFTDKQAKLAKRKPEEAMPTSLEKLPLTSEDPSGWAGVRAPVKEALKEEEVADLKERLAQLLNEILEKEDRPLAEVARDLGIPRQRLNQLKTADRTAAPAAIAEVIGRLGYVLEITIRKGDPGPP